MSDSDVLAERWGRTQLSQLADDPQIKEFWKDQQGEIEEKLTSAGWRLHIQPRDLSEVVAGQVALAWVERKEIVRKPYSLVLIVDVVGREEKTADFLTNSITNSKNADRNGLSLLMPVSTLLSTPYGCWRRNSATRDFLCSRQ